MVLSITLEEAATGVARKVTIPRWEPCDHCHGTGSEPGHDPKECPTCHGTGQVRARRQTIFGYQESITVCPTCGGRGKVVEKPCKECGGEGRIHRRREQEIKIQPGVDNGTRLRVPGAGEMGTNGGSPGDLYIVMEVRDHPVFQRDGQDLHRTVSIPWPQAVMGGKSTVGTLIDGDTEFDIPEGTEPGRTIRVRGKGMPALRSDRRGDLILHVTVDVPKPGALSENAARLVSELAEELGVNTEKEGLLDKLFGGKKKADEKKKSGKKK
jgi:molecular chaperone DnaJ